jgi:hypothetical protein
MAAGCPPRSDSLGRTYYEAMHWPQAAHWFRRAAVEHSGDDSAVFAMQLYLDSLHVIATRAQPPRSVCLQAIADELPGFRCAFCREEPGRSEQCALIERVAIELDERGFAPAGAGAGCDRASVR